MILVILSLVLGLFIYKNVSLSVLDDNILKKLSTFSTEYGSRIILEKAIDTSYWRINHYSSISIISNPYIKERIEHIIQSKRCHGVNILWHEDSSLLEKAIIYQIVNAKRIAELSQSDELLKLYDKSLHFNYQIIHIPDKDFDTTKSLYDQVFPYLYLGYFRTFSDYFKPINQTQKIIFYFDRVDRMFDHPDFYGMMYTLAHDSAGCGCYSVFLTFSNRDHARYVSQLNGGAKFNQVRHDIIY